MLRHNIQQQQQQQRRQEKVFWCMTAVNTGERFLYTGECLGSLLLFERIRSTDGGCSGKSLSSCVIGVVLGFVVATTFWSAPTHALGTIN